ncbi:MAG: hypothetical protein E7Z87_03230 [Cyanobacteria bacterium SIG26]|nr:hypothetical protein [Cyanobacteria bacterium SIG26]
MKNNNAICFEKYKNNIKRGVLAAVMASACLSTSDDVSAKNIDLTPPTLDSINLQDLNIVGEMQRSAYTLTTLSGTTNKANDTIQSYDLVNATRYFDLNTGLEVAKENLVAGAIYKQISYNEIAEKTLQLTLKDEVRFLGSGADTRYYNFIDRDDYYQYMQGTLTQVEKDKFDQKNGITISNNLSLGPSNSRIDNKLDLSDTLITGNFYGLSYAGNGTAINNSGKLGDIKANFYDNHLANGVSWSGGVAINNSGTINSIIGDFVNNKGDHPTSLGGYLPGVIQNSGHIGSIKGNFINNFTEAQGAGIFNTGTIDSIEGIFIGNSITWYHGTAISNVSGGHIGTIKGVFVNNKTMSRGGAIENERSTIDYLYGDFIGNSADTGGAIGIGTIKEIYGDFIGNHANTSGGALYWVTGDYLKGNFINNSSGKGSGALSGPLFKVIEANFIGNHATTHGGAITDEGRGIELIKGDFIGNYIKNDKSVVTDAFDFQYQSWGGAISHDQCNGQPLHKVIGNFIGNYVESNQSIVSGGAISNFYDAGGIIGEVHGDFIRNYVYSRDAEAKAGAYVGQAGASIGLMKSNFIGNYAKSLNSVAYGGAIFNRDSLIEEVIGNFVDNYAQGKTEALGGAIYNDGQFDAITNASFISNYAKVDTDGIAKGGAIYSKKDISLISDNVTSLISGNYIQTGNGDKDYQAIYMGENTNLNIVANNSTFVINDKISGQDSYTLNFKGDENGIVYLNDNINAETINATQGLADINLYSVKLNLSTRDNVLDGNNLNLHSGTLNMINNQVGVSALNNLSVVGDTVMHVDVDLENKVMDRFTAESYGQHTGNVHVTGINLLSDANQNENLTAVYFAQPDLKNNVVNAIGGGTGDLPDSNFQTAVYTPIYKYNVAYDNINQYDGKGDGGYFLFAKGDRIITQSPSGGLTDGGTTGNMSDSFNPAVLGTSAMSAVGASATIGNVMRYSFQNAENFMNIPYMERMVYRDNNKYALSPTGDAATVGTFSPLYSKNDEGSAWVKPYATFESVPLKNGPKVSNISYGTLIGFDTDIKTIGKGWDRIFTGYVGYHGASQRFNGVDSYQNGGLIGGTLTLYKNNFFTATTLSAGASVAQNSHMYGNDNYTMLLGGVANKTGYNIELREGKLIFQPSMITSYTFSNAFDYTNAAGVKIKNDPFHLIQLSPGVRLIGNTKNGWQPYIGVNMVWNLMGKSEGTANGIKLPSMSIKPYVQYGVGVQKRFKDHFMGFAQAMIHSGGRNGISLSGGFRWALGHDCPYETVKDGSKKGWFFAHKDNEDEVHSHEVVYRGNKQFGLYNRKVLKQMDSSQRLKAMK